MERKYKYYSQIGQDRLLNDFVFKNKKHGFFVDVGAHDGIYLSNTKFYEETLDWNGICIEANDSLYQKLVKNRKKSTVCINCAAYNEDNKEVTFTIPDGVDGLAGISTEYDKRHVERVKRESNNKMKNVIVKTRTLGSIFSEYNVKYVDYLSIDVEGAELKVLEGIDTSKVYINVIDIENNYPDTFGPIKNWMNVNGFEHLMKIEWDDVFINKEPFRLM